MIDKDALFTIAELAVTMIGVSGLVAIFLSRGNLHQADRVRFFLILIIGIITAILAYVPYWLSKILTDETSIWQYSSIFSLVLFFLTLGVPLMLFMHAPQVLRLALPRLFFFVGMIFPFTIMTAHVVNALSWPIHSNSTLYEVALLLGVVAMTFHFGSLVLFRAETSADESVPQR